MNTWTGLLLMSPRFIRGLVGSHGGLDRAAEGRCIPPYWCASQLACHGHRRLALDGHRPLATAARAHSRRRHARGALHDDAPRRAVPRPNWTPTWTHSAELRAPEKQKAPRSPGLSLIGETGFDRPVGDIQAVVDGGPAALGGVEHAAALVDDGVGQAAVLWRASATNTDGTFVLRDAAPDSRSRPA